MDINVEWLTGRGFDNRYTRVLEDLHGFGVDHLQTLLKCCDVGCLRAGINRGVQVVENWQELLNHSLGSMVL